MPSSACKTCADRKSTRLNSSHLVISYAVFCLKKKIQKYGPALLSLSDGHPHNKRLNKCVSWCKSAKNTYCSGSCAMKFFFFNDTATTEIYTLSLHDALPI